MKEMKGSPKTKT